jgi:hypothetical protein
MESDMTTLALAILRISTADQYRKRASAMSKQISRAQGARHSKLLDKQRALWEQAANYDWLDGKTKT